MLDIKDSLTKKTPVSSDIIFALSTCIWCIKLFAYLPYRAGFISVYKYLSFHIK